MIKKYIPATIRIHLRPIRAMLYRLIYARLSIGLTRQGVFEQPKEEIEASKYISVIVPIMDSPEFLIRCLRSLEKYASCAEIILIDDGSQKKETIRIIDKFCHKNNWQLVRNDSPVGHSRACEAGARLATRPYICLLNSDAVVTPWSWSAAKHAFESDPRIAVTGPSTSRAFTKQVVQVAEYCRHHWNDCQIFAFAQKYVKAQKCSEHKF